MKIPATAALQSRDFRRFLLSRLSSTLAYQMCGVAIGWEVYERTESALALGAVGAAQFVPSMLFLLYGGHAADRFDRRRISLFAFVGMAMCAVLLAVQAVVPTPLGVGAIYAVAAGLGTCRAFVGPAAQALMPRLVPPSHFPNAVTWQIITFQLGMLLGPALGGVLYGAAGVAWAVYLAAAALLGVAWVGTFLVTPAEPSALARAAAPNWSTLLAGVRYVWGNPRLLGAMSLDLFAVLLGGAVALLPIFAKDILGVGPSGLGALRAAPAMGAALTALVLAYRPFERKLGRVMFAGVFMFGVATVAFGLSTSFPLSLVCLALTGAFDMVALNIRHTLIQLSTPDEMRGRVSAVASLFVGASNELGEMESGALAQWLGPVAAVIVGGVGSCLVVVLWIALFRPLWRVDQITPREAEAG
jgi:MFS family permease